MIEIQRCTDQQIWDEFVLENNGHPLQLWGWGQLKSAHGWSADRMLAYDDDTIVAAAQVLTRKLPLPLRGFSYIPRGPVGEKGSDKTVLDGIADFVKREHHSVVLTIEPDTEDFTPPDGWRRSSNRILPSKTISLDLTKSEDELLGAMVKKTRQYIRKSGAEKMTIRSVRSREELEKCMAVYQETSDRAQFKLHDMQYYYDVFQSLGEHSPVFAAFVDDQPVAFLWLAISTDTSFELYGGMSELGQQLRANYALKWHAIRKTKEWGLRRYDFGGLINDGVSNFKRSWADADTELAGTFDKPLSSFYPVWSGGLPAAKTVIQRIRSLRK